MPLCYGLSSDSGNSHQGVCILGHAWLVPMGMWRGWWLRRCAFPCPVRAIFCLQRHHGNTVCAIRVDLLNVHVARLWKIQRAHTRVRICHTTVCLLVAIVTLWGGASAPPVPLTRWGWTPPDFPWLGGVGPLPSLTCMHVCNMPHACVTVVHERAS